MNGDFTKGNQMLYLNDALDYDSIPKLSINEKIVKLRTLDSALTDKFLTKPMFLYSGFLRLNVDHRLDLAERKVISRQRKELLDIKEQMGFMQSEINHQMIMIKSNSAKENGLKTQIK